MIFKCKKLPDEFDKIFYINDLVKIFENFVIIREGCFIEIVNSEESNVFFIPFWEEKPQYWDLKKIYKFDNKVFILALNIRANYLKLIEIKNIEPFKIEVIDEIKKEIVNIYHNYVFTKENVYELTKDGLKKIDLKNKEDYYNEVKFLDDPISGNQAKFFIIDNKVFPMTSLSKIGNVLTNNGKIKIINFDENKASYLFLEDSDKLKNFIKFPLKYGKIVVTDNNDNIEIFVFDINKSFSINIPWQNNEIHIKELNVAPFLRKKIISSFEVKIKKVDNNRFLLLIINDKYNFFENELFLVEEEFENLQKISVANSFVKKENGNIIFVSNYTLLHEVGLCKKCMNKKLQIDLQRKRKEENIIYTYIDYNKTKKEIIFDFMNSLKLRDFSMENDKYLFLFETIYGLLEIKLFYDGRKYIGLANKEKVAQKWKEQVLVNKELGNELNIVNILMLEKINGKTLEITKVCNSLILSITNESRDEIEIFRISDCFFNSFSTIFLAGNNILFINNNTKEVKVYEMENNLEKIKGIGENKVVVIDDKNYFIHLVIKDEGIEIEEIKNYNITGDFIVYNDKVIFFDGIDCLVVYNEKGEEIRAKLSYLPTKKIDFVWLNGFSYMVIDKKVEFVLQNGENLSLN